MAGERLVAARLRPAGRLPNPPGGLLGAAPDPGGNASGAAAGRGRTHARRRGGHQPARPRRLERRLAARRDAWLAGSTAARVVMELRADSLWLSAQSVDMRIGIDELSLRVQQALGRAPCDGTAYVFSNRRRTRLKLACWDGNGVWMCLRRLHRGQFVWPQAHETSWQLSDAQWQWLIAGVDWQAPVGAGAGSVAVVVPAQVNSCAC